MKHLISTIIITLCSLSAYSQATVPAFCELKYSDDGIRYVSGNVFARRAPDGDNHFTVNKSQSFDPYTLLSFVQTEDGTVFSYRRPVDGALFVNSTDGQHTATPQTFTVALSDNGAEHIDYITLYQSSAEARYIAASFIDNLANRYLMVSDDYGKSWQKSSADVFLSAMQWSRTVPGLAYAAELTDGNKLTLLSTADNGMTWTELKTIPLKYNTLDASVSERHVTIDVCDTKPGTVVVNCLTPFVYDAETSITTPIDVPYAQENNRLIQLGFTDTAEPQLIYFDREAFKIRVSDDLGANWEEYPCPNSIGTLKADICGWVRNGSMIYALSSHDNAIIEINLDKLLTATQVAADASTAQVTATDGGIIVTTDSETDVTVYDIAGQLLKQTKIAGTARIKLSPAIYLVSVSDTTFKVEVQE